jgi:hypothetical protein
MFLTQWFNRSFYIDCELINAVVLSVVLAIAISKSVAVGFQVYAGSIIGF